MGSPRAEVFDREIEAWAAWQQTPWGRLRYRLVSHTLGRAMAGMGERCRVLDAGGGDGSDSLPLARQGHEVTILDYSAALLARAADTAAVGGFSTRVRAVRADLRELAALPTIGAAGPTGRFDLVICHNVLHYLDEPTAAVGGLAGLLRPGGVLSVLAPNPAMDVLAAAVRDRRPAAALALLDATTVRSETFGHDMRRLESATVAAALRSHGLSVTARFGIRCVTDLIADEQAKRDPDFFAELERLERDLCDREPYLRMARFWQLLATRAD